MPKSVPSNVCQTVDISSNKASSVCLNQCENVELWSRGKNHHHNIFVAHHSFTNNWNFS